MPCQWLALLPSLVQSSSLVLKGVPCSSPLAVCCFAAQSTFDMCHLVLFWWRRTCQSSHPRDSSAGGSRPAPATLRGPPTLTDEADTPKRLSSDEECLQHPKVTLVLSERCPPMPFSWCDIPSLPSLVFSTSPALLEKLLSFYYYPLFLPLSPAVPLSTLQPLDGRVEGLASEGSKGGQM